MVVPEKKKKNYITSSSPFIFQMGKLRPGESMVTLEVTVPFSTSATMSTCENDARLRM